MIKIETVFRKKKRTFQLPENWKEMERGQFAALCTMLPALKAGTYTDEGLRRICGCPKRQWRNTGHDQKLMLSHMLSWAAKTAPETEENKIGDIKTKGRRLKGWERHFSNITWWEFAWADTFFMQGRPEGIAAVIWRPCRKGQKEAFDDRKTGERMKTMSKLPQETLTAIYVNWMATRRASLESRYRNIFPRTKEAENDLPEKYRKLIPKKEEPEKKTERPFSWFDLHLDIMGDNITEEDKYRNARLSTVMNHIDRKIAEAKELKRKKA